MLRPSRFALIAGVVCVLVASPALAAAPESIGENTDASAAADFERPEAETIRAEVRRILSDPRFAPRRDFSQWLLGVLRSLKDIFPSRGPHSTALGLFLWWLLTIWCVAALLAILAHMAWTLWMVLRTRMPGRGGRVRAMKFRPVEEATCEQLLAEAQRLAEQGEYAAAMGRLMVALLKWLDTEGLLHWHESKTNGEYVIEYPHGRGSSRLFRRFVGMFDEMIYGGAACGGAEYRRFKGMLERVRQDVGHGT